MTFGQFIVAFLLGAAFGSAGLVFILCLIYAKDHDYE